MIVAALADLADRRVLVVEDEYMIAVELAEALTGAGAEVLGPVSGVAEALGILAGGTQIDAALLDVNLGHEAVWPVVDVLLARGTPVLLATGYDASAIPDRYAHLPRCEKPATGEDLTRALCRTLNSAARM